MVFMYLSTLGADSNIAFLVGAGNKLRWAVLGAVVFKELSYWAHTKRAEIRMTSGHLFLFIFTIISTPMMRKKKIIISKF